MLVLIPTCPRESLVYLQDAADPNPLIRALSVRTMGCIRVDRITEYLCEPLRRCLQDEVCLLVSFFISKDTTF